jgi:RHS repeat-associated protein
VTEPQTRTKYSYDSENRLQYVDYANTATYVYNAAGQRVAKGTPSANTYYIYRSDGQVVAERDAYNNWIQTYIYFGGQLTAVYRGQGANANTGFFYGDHLGSTRLITLMNNPTSPYDNMDYLPFGVQIAGGNGDTHKFTAKERDSESGLDNFGARYFGSSLGRFMVPDPSQAGPDVVDDENPQAWNMYSYVLGNPLNATDPDGLDCVYASGASDNPSPGGAGTVTVVRGDCVNAGGKNDSGVFVNGTIDTNSPVTTDAATGDLNFGLSNENGGYGTGKITNFYAPQTPDQLNPFAQGVFTQLNQMPIEKFVYTVAGTGALIGITGGAACYYLCPEGAGAMTLGEIRPGPGASKAARIAAQGGKKALERAIRSLTKKIAEHEAKIEAAKASGGFTSSMESEVANWKSVVQAMQNILRNM